LFFAVVLLSTKLAASTPREAVRGAIADCQSLDEIDRAFTRYFWLPSGTSGELIAFQYTLNAAVSNAQSIQYARQVNANLVAVDLRQILPHAADFVRVVGVLENYVDPYFHVVQSVDVFSNGQFVTVVRQSTVLKSGTKTIGQLQRGNVGKVASQQGPWVQIVVSGKRGWVLAKDVSLVTFGLHVLPHPKVDKPGEIVNAQLLADLTGSRCPIIFFPRFQTLALTQVDGGFYYDLIGVDGFSRDQALVRFGIDPRNFSNPANTSRVAKFVSLVANGHPRAGKFGNTAGVRPTGGVSIWTASEDISDEDLDVTQHAMYSLFGAQFRFEEVITPKQNGMLIGLIAADGNLADEVGANIAKDHQARPPHHAKVNGWFSCFRCHAQQGYQPWPNDVKLLADANGGDIPVFGDLSQADQIKAVDELKASYLGDLDGVLAQARRDHARTVFLATGVPYEKAYEAVVGTYETYEYDWVTPYTVLALIGHDAEAGKGVELFREVVPPLPVNEFGYSPDDPTIIALRAWDEETKRPEIRVRDLERVFPDIALRALAYEAGGK
jgi:hypothetical protein